MQRTGLFITHRASGSTFSQLHNAYNHPRKENTTTKKKEKINKKKKEKEEKKEKREINNVPMFCCLLRNGAALYVVKSFGFLTLFALPHFELNEMGTTKRVAAHTPSTVRKSWYGAAKTKKLKPKNDSTPNTEAVLLLKLIYIYSCYPPSFCAHIVLFQKYRMDSSRHDHEQHRRLYTVHCTPYIVRE